GKLVHDSGPGAAPFGRGSWPLRDRPLLGGPGFVPGGFPPVLLPPSDPARTESGEGEDIACPLPISYSRSTFVLRLAPLSSLQKEERVGERRGVFRVSHPPALSANSPHFISN